ncbi:hypothetical protein ATKI12_4612 [Kitasatospora sp. Ki12]
MTRPARPSPVSARTTGQAVPGTAGSDASTEPTSCRRVPTGRHRLDVPRDVPQVSRHQAVTEPRRSTCSHER